VKPRAYPRTPLHEADAEAMTDAIRFLADADDFEGKHSAVANDVMVEGLGGVVFYVDTEDINEATEIETIQIPFERIFTDPDSKRPDFSDAQYMGNITWMSLSEAKQRWPDRMRAVETSVDMAVTDPGAPDARRLKWFRRDRKEIQVIEHFFRCPHEEGMEWYECTYVGGGFVEDPRVVQFLDDKGRTWCPQVLCSAYVMAGNAENNERYGIVRNLLGPQDEINHRRSKSIHALHASRIVFEQGALLNPEEAQGELMKPDGKVELTKGSLEQKRFQVLDNAQELAGNVTMLQDAKNEIDQVGPRPIPVPEGGAKISGRLFIAQQEAGAMELKPVFDNLRRWAIRAFRSYWYLIRQTWTEEKWFTVRDPDNESDFRFVRMNSPMTKAERLEDLLEKQVELPRAIRMVYGIEGPRLLRKMTMLIQQQMVQAAQQAGQQPPSPQQVQGEVVEAILRDEISQKIIVVNDAAQMDVDIIVETSANSVIIEHEQFQELVGMVREGILPLDKNVLTVLLEASSLPRKTKLIAMLNQPPSQAEQQAAAMQQQAQMAEMQKRVELLAAQVEKMRADSKKSAAQAALAAAKTQGEQFVAAERQTDAELNRAEATLVPHEANLKDAQAEKARAEARHPGGNSGQGE
jgi:hypothetical protein